MRSLRTGADPETTPGRSPSERNFRVTKWAAAVLASVLIMCVDSNLRAQDPQSAIDDTRQFAEYLDQAHSHINQAATIGNIRAERVLAVIMDKPVEFREAPPYGLLNLLIGRVVDSLQPGTVVDIREEKIVPTFRGGEVWYSIQVLYSPEEQENTQHLEGWINAGVSGFGGLMVANQAAAR
jgi:hypothetical protein